MCPEGRAEPSRCHQVVLRFIPLAPGTALLNAVIGTVPFIM